MTGSQQSGAGGNPQVPRRKKSGGGVSSSQGPLSANRGKDRRGSRAGEDDDEATDIEERSQSGQQSREEGEQPWNE